MRMQTAHTAQQCDTSLAAGPAALTADALSNTIYNMTADHQLPGSTDTASR